MQPNVFHNVPFREIAGVRACDEKFAAVHKFAPQRQKSLNRCGANSV